MGTSVGWHLIQIAGASAAAVDSDIAAVSRFRDNMEVWWFTSDSQVHGAFWYDDGQNWRGPYQVPGPQGPSSTGGIAAVSRIQTSMENWWVGTDLSVRGAFWYDDGNSWRPYQDPVAASTAAAPTSGMAALSRIPTSQEIWWVGLGGTVQGAFWYQGQNNDSWQRYSLTGPGVASERGGVAAVSRIPASMEVWWVGPQGSVEGAFWYATDPNPQWRQYQVAPDGSAAQAHGIAAVARLSTSMDVVWITPEGGIRGAYWNEGGDWQLYPDPIAADGSASLDGGLAAVSRTATGIEVWWIGPDGSVQGATWDEGVGWHRDPVPVAPAGNASTSSGIAAMSRTQTTTQVWWIGPDGSVQLADRDEDSGPFSFRILRPDDMVNLDCDVVGCRLDPGGTLPTRSLSTTYLVQAGDTLWDIATRFYGDPFKYHLIADANHIANPDIIDIGQQLTIPGPGNPPTEPRTLVAVADGAHIVVHFGVQHIHEQAYPNDKLNPPPASGIADARAADPSRVVFELPIGTEMPFSAAGVLAGLAGLGLRVVPLAIPRVTPQDPRPATATGVPVVPAADQTAIEAPYRLVVSPDGKYGAFTHSGAPVVAQDATTTPVVADPSRVELWHSRLGVRGAENGVDEDDARLRTVRPVWTRDRDNAVLAPTFLASLTAANRQDIVNQSADPTKGVEPQPFTVDRFYLSSFGAWLDWRVSWSVAAPLSAYRHQATMGRDQYVRVEQPIYLFPFGHRGTLVTLTQRMIGLKDANPAAYLYQRRFIVLRDHTLDYGIVQGDTVKAPTNFPFVSVTVDPVISPDLDLSSIPDPAAGAPFVPTVGGNHYLWKVTGIDHAGRQVTMTTALVCVPVPGSFDQASKFWVDNVVTKDGLIDLGDAEVAFAPEHDRGDTTSRVKYLELTGTAQPDTSTPSMFQAHITIPALAALNRGGGTSPVKYHDDYVANGFKPGDQAGLYLKLVQGAALDFASGSDRGGGFIQPSVAVNALSRGLGAVGDDGSSGGIADGKFDPAKFLGGVLPKLFGLIDLSTILPIADLAQAPKMISNQLGFIATMATEYGNLTAALQKSADMLQTQANATNGDPGTLDGLKQRYTQLLAQINQAIAALAAQPLKPLQDALDQVSESSNPAQAIANGMLGPVNDLGTILSSPDLPAFLRSLIQRSQQALQTVLTTATTLSKVLDALRSPVQNGAIHYDWYPTMVGWPPPADAQHPTPHEIANYVFVPHDPKGLAISVDIRTDRDGNPQAEVAAQLSNFELDLLPGTTKLIGMKFGRVGFRVSTGGKPEVDVQFDGMEFLGPLEFIDTLRKIIPLDGFSDPPYVDVTADGATAGFDLALPSVAVGVFSLQNISIGADCRVPFLGDAVTVGFNFCAKEAPFRLTVMAIGGGGWVGIRLSPTGLVLLEMGLEAGASLSVDLGVASGSVSVMVGVYLRLEDKGGQLTGYFRIRGEVEVLHIVSASITLELSLTYDTGTHKAIGRASLRIEIEIAFFSTSVEITCEKKLAGSKGDPALYDVMPPDAGGQDIWDRYYSSFAIGA
jgi:LysM repeat protein